MDKKTLLIIGLTIVLIFVLVRKSNNDSVAVPDAPPENKVEAPAEVMEDKPDENEGDKMESYDSGTMMKKDDEKMSGDTMTDDKKMIISNKELVLSAESLGDGEVKFSWTAPEGLDETNRFIIVRDEEINPEHTNKNFWSRQNHLKREFTWIDVPTGEMHFRICLTEDDEKDLCTSYSNNVTLTVD